MAAFPVPANIYAKPYLTVPDQLRLLEGRGLVVSDAPSACACLERIGYYRLSGYWYPFRKTHLKTDPITGDLILDPVTGSMTVIVEDDFRPGTTFQQVMDLYVFDKRLRILFLDAIERLEIALRVDVALLLGKRSPDAHRNPNEFDHTFGVQTNTTGETQHAKWMLRLDEGFLKSKEEFVKHFREKYPQQNPPIWIAVELWDFGMLSVALEGLKYMDKLQLAQKYGLPRPLLFTAAARNLNNIRNICAHHSRLWNRSPADRISPPKVGEVASLAHLVGDTNAHSRLYATAAMLQHLLATVNPSTQWAQRLKDHMKTLPTSAHISQAQAGFPRGWQELPLWNKPAAGLLVPNPAPQA